MSGVALSGIAARLDEYAGAAASGFERLVSRRVTSPEARARHARLIGALLTFPIVWGGAAWLLIPPLAGIGATVALVGCGLGLAWLIAVGIIAGLPLRPMAVAALVLASFALALLIAAAGGLQSPAALVAGLLPVEAWLFRAERRDMWIGGATAILCLSFQSALTASGFVGAPSAWHWLIPVGYAMSALPRVFSAQRRNPVISLNANDFAERIAGGFLVRIGQQGEAVDAGAASRSILGIDPELLLGAGLFERIHLADRVAYLCALSDVRAGALRRSVDLRLRLPGNPGCDQAPSFGSFAVAITPCAETAGQLIALIRDNSESAALRAAVQRTSEMQERLEMAKSRFLAMVSHELRTPLNSIIGFSDMLLHEMFGGFQDPRQKEYVELVRDSGNHLLAVVNSILDVSKMEAGSYAIVPEPFNFGDAVEMCVAMLSAQAQAKSVSISTRIADDVGDIRADRRAVQQMLINLLSNAVKFTPAGGEIEIAARMRGGRLEFSVNDSGIGISEDDLGRIGRPFTQIRNDYTRQFEGAGLGLSLVRGLVTLHEGTMSIESAVGDGTCVTITLPLDGPNCTVGESRGELLTMSPGRQPRLRNGTFRKVG